MNQNSVIFWSPIYYRDIRSTIGLLLLNPPVLKKNYATTITHWVMNHRHNTCCHAYFFLQCECILVLEECDIDLIIKIVKQMKELVRDYHSRKLVPRSKPPSDKYRHWNHPSQAIYTRGTYGTERLQSGYPPPNNRITKRNMYPTYNTIVQRHDHFREMSLEQQIHSIRGYFTTWSRTHMRNTHTVNSIVINNVVERTANIVQPEGASRTAKQAKGNHTVNRNMASGLIREIEEDIVIDSNITAESTED